MNGEKNTCCEVMPKWPRTFFLRRLHSLAGAWIGFYLLFHLFVNVQAAFYFNDGAKIFSAFVNAIHCLPWLALIEILLIGIPILYHATLGVLYLWQGKMNSFPTDGSKPSLIRFPRNHAYSFQRITAWILIVGVSLHVIQMRFLSCPERKVHHAEKSYLLVVDEDPGLKATAERVGVTLNEGEKAGEWVASSAQPGPLFFLEVRSIMKSLLMVFLYSIFTIAASFHAMNGLWTFAITWGITLPHKSQVWMRRLTTFVMAFLILFGLGAVWGLYFTFWA